MELYPDRLEVSNPGALPYGFTIDQLTQLHNSKPSNPILAHPVYLAGYIERIGTGTQDIVEKRVEAGLHRQGSGAVTHYTMLELADRFKLMNLAFDQEDYRVDKNLEVI